MNPLTLQCLLVLGALALLGACAETEPERVLTREDAATEGDSGDTAVDDADAGADAERDPDADRTDVVDDQGRPDADMTPSLCQPNGDGVLDQDEVPLAVGAAAKFGVSEGTTVDLVGTSAGGTQSWDFAGSITGEVLRLAQLQSLDGQWFAPSFPTADYAAELSASTDLLGVFRVADGEVLLLGVVSPADGLTRTELEYDPPVPVLSFPLEEGSNWSVTTTVTGLALGIAAFYTETYDYSVTDSGEAATPFADFDVLRMDVELQRTVGLLTTTSRSVYFLSECFGTVTKAVSEDGEVDVDFDTASELWRLSP